MKEKPQRKPRTVESFGTILLMCFKDIATAITKTFKLSLMSLPIIAVCFAIAIAYTAINNIEAMTVIVEFLHKIFAFF